MLGYLLVKSAWTTKVLGYVLVVAGAAYIVDTVARAVIADYANVEDVFLVIVAVPAVIAELWFTVWLREHA